jgi:hypothetical protein
MACRNLKPMRNSASSGSAISSTAPALSQATQRSLSMPISQRPFASQLNQSAVTPATAPLRQASISTNGSASGRE